MEMGEGEKEGGHKGRPYEEERKMERHKIINAVCKPGECLSNAEAARVQRAYYLGRGESKRPIQWVHQEAMSEADVVQALAGMRDHATVRAVMRILDENIANRYDIMRALLGNDPRLAACNSEADSLLTFREELVRMVMREEGEPREKGS